jgi:hypothetical protein
MASRGQKLLLGCGLGCAGLVVLLLSTCVGFQMWLRSPGELLDPALLLDPQAVGWAEARLDLDDEATETLAEALLELSRPTEGMFEGSPVLAFLEELNASRQERRLRRLFPLTAAWTLYPGEAEREPVLLSVSVPAMAHTLALVDWGIGFVARFQPELVTESYRGERILVVAEAEPGEVKVRIEDGLSIDWVDGDGGEEVGVDSDELRLPEEDAERAPQPAPPEAPFVAHVFLRDVGIFFATSGEAARRAIDGLEGGPAQASGSPLERVVAGLEDAPLRAAVLNDDSGRLERLLARLLPEGVLDDETREVLRRARSATLLGRLRPGGELELSLTLAGVGADDATRSALEAATERFLETSEVGGSASVAPALDGVGVVLVLPIQRAAERSIEEGRASWR